MDCRCANCGGKIVSPRVCQGCQLAPYCSLKCLEKHESKHKTQCERQSSKLVEAYCKAATLMVRDFPNSSLSMIASLDWEESLCYNPRCLVGRILWNVGYFRPCIFVADAMGSPIFVAFYLDGSASPYFDVKDLQPGNVILFNRALKHRFMDGQIGLRIEDPSDVRIVRMN